MHILPVTLRPDERRDLARRLAERLGTKTAGGLSLLAREEEGRLHLQGEAGDVKIKGVQEIGTRQRDAIGIGGLPEGLGIVLTVDEAVPGAARDAPLMAPAGNDGPSARVAVDWKGGPPEAQARALEEAFRYAGERFTASLAKKQAVLVRPPLAPLEEEELRRHLRGRWTPLREARLDTRPPPHLQGVAAVLPQKGEGPRLLVRPSAAGPRAATPVALLHDGLTLAHLEVDRHLDGKQLERALASLAWDLLQQTAAEPRPLAEPVAIEPTAGPFETAALVMDRPARGTGTVRAVAAGKGARLAALDLTLATAEGKPCGSFVERHLLGLPGDGFVLAASSSLLGHASFTLAVAEAKLEKWILRLEKGIGGEKRER